MTKDDFLDELTSKIVLHAQTLEGENLAEKVRTALDVAHLDGEIVALKRHLKSLDDEK